MSNPGSSQDPLSAPLSQLRMTTKIRNEAEQILTERGIGKGEAIVTEKPPPAAAGETCRVKTNMFSIRMEKEIPVHRYDLTIRGIYGTLPELRVLDFTRRSSSDVLATDRKHLCRIALGLLLDSETTFPKIEECVYDLQAILFSLKKFPIAGDNTREVMVPPNHAETFRPCFKLQFIIKPVEQFNLVLGPNLTVPSLKLEEQNYDMQQFLEILTSQHAMSDASEHITFESGRSYLLNPENFGFDVKECPPLGRGTYLAMGCQKSCRIIEGPKRGDPRAVMVLESKKTPFHEVQPVLDKCLAAYPNFMTDATLHKSVKNLLFKLFVQPMHIDRQPFQVFDIHGNAESVTFSVDGRVINVRQYFLEKYNLTLKAPLAPLIVGRDRNNKSTFYPMEVLQVCDNQRLTSAQLTPEQTVQIIKSSAVPPSKLNEHIRANCVSLRLGTDPTMRQAGIAIREDPIVANGKCLSGPSIEFANTKVKLDKVKGTWANRSNNSRYLIPASFKVWAAYFCTYQPWRDNNCLTFLKGFEEQCKRKGIAYCPPAEWKSVEPAREGDTHSALRDKFRIAKEANCSFILVVSDAKDFYVHKHLKQLEQEFDICTQNVKHTTAAMACQNDKSRLTMENVVHKTNVKLGGLNHAIVLEDSRQLLGLYDLFLGFGMNHPGGFTTKEESKKGPPSVVGYSANDLKHPCAFSGDYLFQESRRDEKITIIDDILKTVINRYKNHRGRSPQRLFLYRNGCSEGQFTSVLRFEIPIIKDSLAKLGCSGTKITVIVPNRQHNMRFYPTEPNPQAKPWDQNLQPGTVLDSVIVHPSFFEFYLLSHQARQGTAKVPRYTVIYDDNGMNERSMEDLTFALAFGHQIVACPVGLPAPCYIADCYAERGRMVYNTHSTSQALEDVNNMDLGEMTEKLSYMNKVLRDQRFNA